MTQVNPFYEEAKKEVARLQQERAELIIKLSNPYRTINDEERIGLRIQEIERGIPAVWVQASERQRRAEAKALAEKIDAQVAADEAAKAAADEAARQERIKASAKAAFLRDGGAPENFELVWPGIKANLAAEAALQAARKATQTEQAGGDIRQMAANALREKYRLPKDGEFSRTEFLGRDAFANLEATYTPADDVPADAVAEVA